MIEQPTQQQQNTIEGIIELWEGEAMERAQLQARIAKAEELVRRMLKWAKGKELPNNVVMDKLNEVQTALKGNEVSG